jgi:hypothetical protein
MVLQWHRTGQVQRDNSPERSTWSRVMHEEVQDQHVVSVYPSQTKR